MNKETLLNKIQSFLNEQHFAVLATRGNEYPYCSLVGYAVCAGYKEIIFPTARQTHKYENLKNNPKVSLLIDSQTNKENDFKNAQALTVLGDAGEIENTAGSDGYSELYLKKHPYLKEFISNPDCALIKVIVLKYILVNNFQNVLEYSVV